MTSLSTDFTDKLFADYEANAKYSAIENAVTHNGLLKSIETRQSEVENDHVFSIDLTKDEVSNQKASGRCWMFAALNFPSQINLRLQIGKFRAFSSPHLLLGQV